MNKRKIVLYLASAVVAVLLVGQVFIDICVFRSVIMVRPEYGTIITTLIGDATKQLNKPAPVDPATGKVYIPEARLVLPAYTGLGQIEYMYEGGQYASSNTAEIHLTSSAILNLAQNKLRVDNANANNRMAWQSYNGSSVFASVPSLQACTRGVQLFYARQSPGGVFLFQGARQLNDGRTLYIYTENNCKQNQSIVVDLAKQAQSY